MKISATAALVLFSLVTAGCRSIPPDHEALCSKIASFANATDDSSTHTVELVTNWDNFFTTSETAPSPKICRHDDSPAGIELCTYLLENTSTEFPDANLNSVMVCLGAAAPSKLVYDLEYTESKFWSHVASGVQSRIVVGVDYSAETESALATLKIMARKDE